MAPDNLASAHIASSSKQEDYVAPIDVVDASMAFYSKQKSVTFADNHTYVSADGEISLKRNTTPVFPESFDSKKEHPVIHESSDSTHIGIVVGGVKQDEHCDSVVMSAGRTSVLPNNVVLSKNIIEASEYGDDFEKVELEHFQRKSVIVRKKSFVQPTEAPESRQIPDDGKDMAPGIESKVAADSQTAVPLLRHRKASAKISQTFSVADRG